MTFRQLIKGSLIEIDRLSTRVEFAFGNSECLSGPSGNGSTENRQPRDC